MHENIKKQGERDGSSGRNPISSSNQNKLGWSSAQKSAYNQTYNQNKR